MRSGKSSNEKKKRSDAAQYINSIYFRPDYHCPDHIRFKTFFEYWIFVQKRMVAHRKLSESSLYHYVRTYLSNMRSLDTILLKYLRPFNVEQILDDLSVSKQRDVILLYKKLDRYAHKIGLIPASYSRDMEMPPLPASEKRQSQALTIEELLTCFEHQGELPADLAILMSFTGISIGELTCLSLSGNDNHRLTVTKTDILAQQRSVPIKDCIEPSLTHILQYLEEIDGQSYEKKYSLIKKQLKKCKAYGIEHISGIVTRDTFCDQLLLQEVSVVVINVLLGTKNKFNCNRLVTYFHPSENRLKRAIDSLPDKDKLIEKKQRLQSLQKGEDPNL